jgi:AraC-like DNA-binding protein
MKTENFRRRFLRQIGGVEPFSQLFDLLPDVAFFLKDRRSRFVQLNRRSCEYCHVASEREAIGRTDHDFFPKDRADLYRESDRKVMRTGVPVLNAMDPAPEEAGSNKLIVYSKVPVRDRQGRIIGIAGIHREIEGLEATPNIHHRLSRALQYLQENYASRLTTRQLAKMTGVSSSQFDRHFRRLFNTTLRQYLLRVRVHAACRGLAQTDKNITEIALETGFYDHAHFTRTFSRLMGIAPLAYRKRQECT